MNKTELIEHVADKANLTKTQTQDALAALLETITQKVAAGDKVTLVGFGSFEAKVRSAREGRNPRTGETVQVPAARVPTFSAGNSFREAVNIMTDPLQSYDLDLLKRYDAQQQELETLPPAAIELPPLQALAVITHLQIATANPAVASNPLLPSAIAAAKHIQSCFSQESAIYEVIELGWHEEEVSGKDVPHKIFTSVCRRSKKPRRPR